MRASATTPLRPTDPAELGPYRLLGRIGHGGQGVVYLGEDETGARAAVKTLHQHGDDPRLVSRFAGEIAAAQRVEAFCTAQVLSADLEAQPPYVASEYVEGPTLQAAVRSEGPRRGSALMRIAVATTTALAAIHEAGVVHRDFKPGNVLLGPDGARVIDFGIARHTESTATATNRIVGTPAYMAPEQVRGRQVGPAADVFAWGCVMVFAATGSPPFGTDDVVAVIGRVTEAEPELGDLADPLRGIVAECLAKDPAGRPTAESLLFRLLGRKPAAAAGTGTDTGTRATLDQGRKAAAGLVPVPPPGMPPVRPQDRPADRPADRPPPNRPPPTPKPPPVTMSTAPLTRRMNPDTATSGPPGPEQAYHRTGSWAPPPAAPPYGEPAYREPAYREPGYREPGYGEPGYGEPRYGEAGRHPGPASHPDDGAPRSRRYAVAAGIVAGLLVVAVVVVITAMNGGGPFAGPGPSPDTSLTSRIGPSDRGGDEGGGDSPRPSRTATTVRSPSPERSVAPGRFPAAFGGTWSGTIKDPKDVAGPDTVTLTMPAGRTSGTIRFANLQCGGTLDVDHATAQEVRATGHVDRRCVPTYAVRVRTRDDGRLDYRESFTGNQGDRVTYRGILTRNNG